MSAAMNRSASAPGSGTSAINSLGTVALHTVTKPTSCKRILSHAGEYMAEPHHHKEWKGAPPRHDWGSTSMTDYCARDFVSAASQRKPLEPYNANAFRNRLEAQTPKPLRNNWSQIELGIESGRRRFVTNAQNDFRGISGKQSKNAGIIAEKTKWFHHLQST